MVTSELEESANILHEKNVALKGRLQELQSQITQVEAELAVLDQERRIVEDVADYYTQIENYITECSKSEPEDAPVTTLTEKDPQKVYSLRQLFSNEDNILDNILENVQPSLNENDKAEIKKYANDLVSQFNRLLGCF